MPLQEIGDVASNRRVGGIRQAELDDCGASLQYRLIRRDTREKTVDNHLPDFFPLQLDCPCAADQPGAAAQ